MVSAEWTDFGDATTHIVEMFAGILEDAGTSGNRGAGGRRGDAAK